MCAVVILFSGAKKCHRCHRAEFTMCKLNHSAHWQPSANAASRGCSEQQRNLTKQVHPAVEKPHDGL